MIFKNLVLVLVLALQSCPLLASCYDKQVMTTASAGSNHLTDDSQDSAVYGDGINLSSCYTASIQANWASITGTINAVVSVEVSTDCVHYIAKDDGSGNPVTFTLSGATGADSISLNGGVVTEKCYRVRYAHNNVSGGTINMFVVGK